MRFPTSSILLLASSLLAAGCFDFGYEAATAGGGDAHSQGSPTGGLPTSSEAGPTSSGAGASAATSGSTGTGTTTSSSGGGGDGVGGGGGDGGAGGGAPACSPPGDGPDSVAAPWAFEISPLQGVKGGNSVRSAVSVASATVEGDRLVVAFFHAGTAPLTFSGEPVASGDQPGFFLAWVDDSGDFYDAFRLDPLAVDAEFSGIDIDVAPGAPGHVRVAVVGTASTYQIIDVDLCTRASSPVVDCSGAQVQSPQVEGDAQGGWAFSFNTVQDPTDSGPVPVCDVFPRRCPKPAPPTQLDTFIWRIAPDGGCSSVVIRDAAESPGGISAFQTATVITLTTEGDVLAVGHYDGALFEDDAPIATGRPYFAEDGATIDFHKFFVHLQPRGPALVPIQAFDIGLIGNPGSHRAQLAGDDTLIAASAETTEQPLGPFVPPLADLVPVGDRDVFFARVTPSGSATAAWIGTVRGDDLADFTHTFSGGFLAATSFGEDVDATCLDGGCALYAFVPDAGPISTPLVLNAVEMGALDVAHSAFALPDGDAYVVGSTTGSLAITSAAPPDGASLLYLARVADAQ